MPCNNVKQVPDQCIINLSNLNYLHNKRQTTNSKISTPYPLSSIQYLLNVAGDVADPRHGVLLLRGARPPPVRAQQLARLAAHAAVVDVDIVDIVDIIDIINFRYLFTVT